MQNNCDVLVIGAWTGRLFLGGPPAQGRLLCDGDREDEVPLAFVIGESLLPHCMDLLQEADFLEAAAARGYNVKVGALFLRGEERCDFNFSQQHTKGWNYTWQVPRADFDKTLIDTVAARGVPVLFEHEVKAVDVSQPHPVITIADPASGLHEVRARFIIDASGDRRVLPRLLDLDEPSRFPMRKAVLAHVSGDKRSVSADSNRIWIVLPEKGGWVWVIPFSNGITSLGLVADVDVFNRYPSKEADCLRDSIASDRNLQSRLSETEWALEPRTISAYSCAVRSCTARTSASWATRRSSSTRCSRRASRSRSSRAAGPRSASSASSAGSQWTGRPTTPGR